MLSEGSSGPGQLLGSGEVRTDRWIPWRRDGERPVEPFEFTVAPDGSRRVQRPDGQRGLSGERTEVGFLWEWYAGDRSGQETIRLTRRIFLDGQEADPARVEVMRRNAVAGLAELNAQGGRLPAVRPGGLVDGSDLSGPRLELVVEFVDSVADAHDVVQVRDGRPQAPGEMVQNVWYTQASSVLLAHEIAHGYGPRDAQAHDGGRALLASPRDEEGWPLGVPLTSHGDEAQQAGGGRWDLMGPIDVGEPGRSYGLTPHELGQIADILSPFLHHGVSAPKPRMAAEAPSPDAAPAVNMSMVEERDRPFVRQSRPGEILFRFGDRPPEEIYKAGGFHPRAPQNLTPIWDWAKYTNSPSQFVSTTRDPKLWFKGKRYRYDIDTSLMEDPCGIDINVTIALEKVGGRLPRDWRNYYPHEQEVVFTGSIPAEAFVGFYDGREKRRGTWNPASGEVEWSADGEERQGSVLPSPDQLGQPGGGSEPPGVPHVTESAHAPASVDSVPAGAGGSEASSDPSESSDASRADGSDGDEMASPDAMPVLSHEQAGGPMATAGNPAGLDPESGDAGVNPDDDESSSMADLQSTTITAVAQDEDDDAWTGRPAPGRPELGENVALAAGLSAAGEDSSRQAGGAGVSSVGPGVLPGDSSGLGELLGSGEVRTDRWLPYGVNPGRSDEERSGRNRRRDGERPVEPFEFIVAPDGRRRVQRPDGRRGHSGELTEVGYGWEWYAGDRPGQETIRLTRRLFLKDQDADPARVAAMRLRLAAFMEQVNREGNRLNVFQPDQVTGPQLPGPRVQFAVEFVDSKDRAHQEVQVRDGLPGGARDMVQNHWYTDVHPAAHFHEVFHGYGPRDDDASEKVLLTPGGRSTQVLSAGESSLMGKFENLQSRIVITSDHLQQIADILTPYLPYGGRALTDRVPAADAAGGEADAVAVRSAAEPATESVALSGGASPGETQEAPAGGDTAPAVDYRMVHKPEMAPSDGGLDHEPTEPGDDSASAPDAGQQKIVFARIETALEVHRPPRIDHSMPSPSPEGGPVRFDDDSRLPGYLTGDGADDTEGRSYGHSQVTLRGADLALQEISEIVSTHLGGETSTVPGLSEVLADLSQAMRTAPQTFHGDGYQSSAFGNSPIRVLRVVTRPYGNWERFTDLHGEPVKVEVAQRSQVTAGAVQSVGAGRRAARGVSVLPAPGAAAFARLGVTAGSTRTAEYGMQDETVSQVETRMAETSHLHLDDVAYEVSLRDVPETRELRWAACRFLHHRRDVHLRGAQRAGGAAGGQ
ncbi:scabin-related ADP-ribosyltransferase [Streptomyces griseoflavus]|uniref:scabin-related ADP-ribosyltransferase n=1 Tax=Streptomyces griseoflavus TaxID=35619 RepID=UPI00131A2135|nr:hypothetical protein [Streptomyces griseoflavus]